MPEDMKNREKWSFAILKNTKRACTALEWQWFAFGVYFMILVKFEVMVSVSTISEALRQHVKGRVW